VETKSGGTWWGEEMHDSQRHRSSEETWGSAAREGCSFLLSPPSGLVLVTQIGSVRVVFISEEIILLEGSQRQILVKPQRRKK
jgi:hypothetical protein